MTQESAEGKRFRFPAPEEMLAIERSVRRARAQAIARLFAAAGHQLKELIRRAQSVPPTSSQFPTKRKTMTTLFWQNALASLPPSVQPRYAASFEAAERFDALLDLGIEGWGSARHSLAKVCQAAAHAMRVTARILDGAARRLLPMR